MLDSIKKIFEQSILTNYSRKTNLCRQRKLLLDIFMCWVFSNISVVELQSQIISVIICVKLMEKFYGWIWWIKCATVIHSYSVKQNQNLWSASYTSTHFYAAPIPFLFNFFTLSWYTFPRVWQSWFLDVRDKLLENEELLHKICDFENRDICWLTR